MAQRRVKDTQEDLNKDKVHPLKVATRVVFQTQHQVLAVFFDLDRM